MRFDSVIGQERAKELLQRATEQGRLGHSYLFTGPDGVGKTLLAQDLATGLFCRSARERPCGECRDCRMMKRDGHPDFLMIEPEGESRVIKIGQITPRDKDPHYPTLIEFLTVMPVQAERRVAIIREAESLNEEASNAMLKTLEEPASFALLILTTSRAQSLLPTIRSRAQEVRFAPLSPAQIRQIISARPELTEEEMSFAARYANGSAGQALAVLDAGGQEVFHEIIAPLLADAQADIFEMSDRVADWARQAGGKRLEPQRERVREFLRLLSCVWRDALVRRAGQDELLFAPTSQKDARADALGISGILRIEEAIWNARWMIDHNVTMNLALVEMFERIARIRKAA